MAHGPRPTARTAGTHKRAKAKREEKEKEEEKKEDKEEEHGKGIKNRNSSQGVRKNFVQFHQAKASSQP